VVILHRPSKQAKLSGQWEKRVRLLPGDVQQGSEIPRVLVVSPKHASSCRQQLFLPTVHSMQLRLCSAEQCSLVVVGLVESEVERTALAQWAASIW